MRVAIHQPEYFPWLGLLDKARRADVLVLLDDVQFNRASLQHRCKIASPKKPFTYLTIPAVHCRGQLIRDVKVAESGWVERHLSLIEEGYRKAPAFAPSMSLLRQYFMEPSYSRVGTPVAGIAVRSMFYMFTAFGVTTTTIPAVSVAAEGQKGARVLDICKRLGATSYLSGKSGAEYLDREAFAAAGIEIEVQQYEVPRYREGQPTEPGLSALDAWMYLGDRAKELLT